MESLTHEQDKLVLMGTIKPCKDQDFVTGDSKVDPKGKKKDKKPPDKKGDNSKSHEESTNSEKKKFQKNKGKGEGSKCTYCGKGFHPESSCKKKKIYMLTQLLEKNNISFPSGANKKDIGSFLVVASTLSYPSFIINSRASRRMV